MNAISLYRLERTFYLHHLESAAKFIQGIIFLLYNSFIPYTCQIGQGTTFAYKGMGVVIHSKAKIGKNCIIAQQVTVGGRSKIPEVPVIGDNVYLGAGAKVLGDINIGDECVIGANAVVIKNVESGCSVAGVPAKVIKRGIKMRDYV
ncbi:serine O-acetyltransferase [Murimonas intestini]|uniref:serine O-acetyltransferase n=1 Tax=Murimonas intestini TaxID=1337051 RepID=UPI0011DDB70C|nr:serine acetyltransferase [Murimonas intestini]